MAGAQDSATVAATREPQGYVTRAELETQLARLEGPGTPVDQRAQAAAIRERLREGDFTVGDRIVLTSTSFNLPEQLASALNAAYTVRDGKVLRIPQLGDLSLQGVLRSELDSAVNAHVARSLRNVTVRAEPTIQVMVTGPVQRPGYHSAAPDMTITEVLMGAAVPTAGADLSKTVVKRAGEEIIDADSLSAAIRSGATLDRIDFQSGDEFALVARRERSKWQLFLQVVGVVSSVASLIYIVDRIS
ncbi:MAG TPA: hypothetical protein VGE02_10695 [Gemmatimonadales bacterium]